jgi:hypothetical protein
MPLPYNRPATLAGLTQETDTMRVACYRCGLNERLSVAEAFASHGSSETVWEVAEALALDCPRRNETRPYELCQVHCPTLSEFERRWPAFLTG